MYQRTFFVLLSAHYKGQLLTDEGNQNAQNTESHAGGIYHEKGEKQVNRTRHTQKSVSRLTTHPSKAQSHLKGPTNGPFLFQLNTQ